VTTLRVAIVADDLTGAADSALAFRREGFSVAVTTSRAALGALAAHAEVVGVDLRTRYCLPELAYLETFSAVKSARSVNADVFKKLDSQLRGNPADELAGALDAWPEALAIASPALPAFGRVVRDGQLHCPGPGHLRSLFDRLVGEAGRTYAHLPLSELRGGRAPASLSRLPAGAIALADAEEEADLAALVEAGSEIGRPVIWAGSAGLAAHVANALASASSGATAVPPVPRLSEVPSGHTGRGRGSGAALVLVATREQIARQQVAALASCGAMVTEVALDRSVTSWALERKPVLQAHLAAGGTVVVRAPASDASSEEVADHARLVVSAGETVRAGLAGTGIVATGGETARAVLEALGEKTGWVIGEVEMAMPLLVTDEGHLGLVTKAGSFGGPPSLVHAVDALKSWRQQVQEPL
jgi:4-hydroxythreonine-4-phosphate dehydrogenase